jgi:hypothetical protein
MHLPTRSIVIADFSRDRTPVRRNGQIAARERPPSGAIALNDNRESIVEGSRDGPLGGVIRT